MAQALGRAPSPYRRSTARRNAANDNRAARGPGKPANSNTRTFGLPNKIARDIPKDALRRAVPRAVQRRALMTAAKLGLRFVPYVGLALTLFEILALLYEALKLGGLRIGSRYAGYKQVCKTGPGPYLYGGGGGCTFWGHWDWASMRASDALVRANVATQTAGSFDAYYHVPGQNIGPYELFIQGEGWIKAPGQVNPVPQPYVASNSPGNFIDAVTNVDPKLGNDLKNLIGINPVAPPDPISPPANRPADDIDAITLSQSPRFQIDIGGKPNPTPIKPISPGVSTARPPGRRVYEPPKPSGSGRTIARIMRGLDALSETAEVIDILFQSLPCAIQRAAAKGRKGRGLLDQAGQYGIEGADWKSPVIVRHYDKIDWHYALEGIARNAVEDQIIGRLNAAVKPVYKGPADMLTAEPGKAISKFVGIAPRCQ